MRHEFLSYYLPNEHELKSIWDNGLVVLDANVLLNLYRYTPQTRNAFLSTLRNLSEKLWIPNQSALEYQKNRLEVISQQVAAYKEIKDTFSQAESRLKTELGKYRKHPYVNISEILSPVQKTLAAAIARVEKAESRHADLIPNDELREQLTSLLDGKVGSPYTEERKNAVMREGEERYKKKIPPGYADQERKTEGREYGDLMLWKQILEKASSDNRHVILVTDDVKEDWWWRFKGKTLGPRPELAEEFSRATGQRLYMYQSDRFISYAETYLNTAKNEHAINEIRSVREHVESNERTGRLYSVRMLKDELTSALIETEEKLAAASAELVKLTGRLRDLKSAGADVDVRQELSEVQLGLATTAKSHDNLRKQKSLILDRIASVSDQVVELTHGEWVGAGINVEEDRTREE